MPHAVLLSSLIDNGEPEIKIRELALANGAPCSGSANTIDTLAAGAATVVVLINDREWHTRRRQIGVWTNNGFSVVGHQYSVVDDDMDDHEH